jgi:hypothetical protein
MFSDYLTLIEYHLQRTGFAAEDLYKLLFQGTLGVEHLLSNIDQSRQRLQSEWESQPAEKGEPLYVPVSPDLRLVRLNIRPFKARGADWQELWHLFCATAAQFHGEKNNFIALWQQSLQWIRQGRLPLNPQAAEVLDAVMREQGYPAAHHSAGYRAANRPAYRIVLSDSLAKNLIER